ncbi:MAG: NADH-quinone oxidoreductase subunit M [Deltaproteobacteria bacterium]|nr:NADH-quinone oxidoreductase subunit M [Deltaproteobacteria bacterium]MBW2398603.1 NADH-quinone oxidoreductase subunit M [Deltaproteobacteria bacterium]MBW2664823.1 NADH-quinone oxidoreductase subunit M [Deltaproteobacteria bacterium]
MTAFVDDNLLLLITFLPLGTALALLVTNALGSLLGLPRLPTQVWRITAVAGSILTFLLALQLVFVFDPVSTRIQFVDHREWLPDLGIHHYFGVDGISLFLVALTALLVPVAFVAAWNDIDSRLRSFVFCMLALETGMIGAFVSLNLFEFYMFWELMLVPMYFMIGIWGGPRRIYAALKFFLFTMFGSVFMLIAMVVLGWLAYEQSGSLVFDLVAPPGMATPALLDVVVPLSGDAPWWKTQSWLFAAFALAFAIKIPIVPFHTWLPDAHVEAPTAGSVILAAVLLKMGTYGFLRFGLPLFPTAAMAYGPWLIGLALVGIIYGSLVAMVQSDVKKLVAYSSVAHMGFVVLGIFVFNVEGLVGGVLQMINHGISTSALFLLVGFLYERRHTREISDFGGTAKAMPVHAAFLGIVIFASIGLPMLNGFVGEILILMGAFLHSPGAAIVAAIGVALSAAYMLWMYRRVAFGPVEHPENRSLIDLSLRERVVMLLLLVPIFWIGIYPDPFLRRIEPSVIEVLRQVDRRAEPGTRSDVIPPVREARP